MIEGRSNYPPTIRDLLQLQPTLRQLEILARADRLLPTYGYTVGRYYGGRLGTLIVRELTEEIKE